MQEKKWYEIKIGKEILEGDKENYEKSLALAFDKKYGNFDYSKDIRAAFFDWNKSLKKMLIKQFKNQTSLEVLGAGSNCGQELIEIFGNGENIHCTVVDISETALKLGKKTNPRYSFVKADLNYELPMKTKFDVCLCLRTIQCHGIDIKSTIKNIAYVMDDDGMIIMSIPNGYLIDGEIKKGMFDGENFNLDKVKDLTIVVADELKKAGCKRIKIKKGITEIFVIGFMN